MVNTALTAIFDTLSGNIAETGATSPVALDGTDIFALRQATPACSARRSRSRSTTISSARQPPATSDFVADNTSGSNPTMSGSGNLIRNNFPGISGAAGFSGDIASSADPLLSALGVNGGPTETMALMSTSPAEGAGNPVDYPGTSGVISADQRGYARIPIPMPVRLN